MNYHFKIWPLGIHYNFWKSLITKENCRDEFVNLNVRIVGHTPRLFSFWPDLRIFSLWKMNIFRINTEKKSVKSWKIHFRFQNNYSNITHYKMKGESQMHMIFWEIPEISSSFIKIKSILDWKNTFEFLGPKSSSC